MPSKIKIKIGEVEVEYEGSDEFLKEELPVLLKTMFDLYAKSPKKAAPKNGNGAAAEGESGEGTSLTKNTTSGYAQKFGSKSGTSLALAAAFSLTSTGKESFSAADIRTEMKSAKAYYKESFGSNLDKSLKGLVKSGKLNDVGVNQYSLSQQEIDKLKSP